MFPDLCAFPFATSGVSNHRAFNDLVIQEAAIVALIEAYDSRLDDIVPPDVVRAALTQFIESSTLDRYKLPRLARKIIDKARWQYGSRRLHVKLTKKRHWGNSAPWNGGLPKLSPRHLGKLLSIRYFFRK